MMARKRRKKTFARFTNKFPFFQLGLSPSKHVHHVRRLVGQVGTLAEQVVSRAEHGNCHDATVRYSALQYRLGELRAHKASTSDKNYSGERAMVSRVRYAYPRQVVAARQALRKFCKLDVD